MLALQGMTLAQIGLNKLRFCSTRTVDVDESMTILKEQVTSLKEALKAKEREHTDALKATKQAYAEGIAVKDEIIKRLDEYLTEAKEKEKKLEERLNEHINEAKRREERFEERLERREAELQAERREYERQMRDYERRLREASEQMQNAAAVQMAVRLYSLGE